MEKNQTNKNTSLWGILLSLAVAVPAYFLGKAMPLVGGSVFAIALGILISFWKRPAVFSQGIGFTSKKILQYSIIFIGMGLDFRQVLEVGKQSIVVMICTITASLVTAWLLGKVLKVNSNTSVLIGVGTSICGGSAIAATAPVIDADDDEVAYAISTIFLFNILAVFIFPALGRLFAFDDARFGMWAGTAINDTSSVVAAAFSFSEDAGEFATIVKLTRTLAIIPITICLAIYRTKRGLKDPNGKKLSIVKIFPWFVLGFLAAVIITTILPASAAPVVSFLNKVGKFGIITAMAAIGLNSNIKKIVSNGIRPILLGLGCWVAVAVVSIIVQSAMGI